MRGLVLGGIGLGHWTGGLVLYNTTTGIGDDCFTFHCIALQIEGESGLLYMYV